MNLIYPHVNNEISYFRNLEYVYVVLFSSSQLGTLMTFTNSKSPNYPYAFWSFSLFLFIGCVLFAFHAHSGLALNRAIRIALENVLKGKPNEMNGGNVTILFHKEWCDGPYHLGLALLLNCILFLAVSWNTVFNECYLYFFPVALVVVVIPFSYEYLYKRGVDKCIKLVPMFCSMMELKLSKSRRTS